MPNTAALSFLAVVRFRSRCQDFYDESAAPTDTNRPVRFVLFRLESVPAPCHWAVCNSKTIAAEDENGAGESLTII